MIKKMLLKYIFVGVTNTFITLIISFICLKLMFSYQSSYSIGFFAGFINSMIMNNLYTFKDKRKKLNIKYILNNNISLTDNNYFIPLQYYICQNQHSKRNSFDSSWHCSENFNECSRIRRN